MVGPESLDQLLEILDVVRLLMCSLMADLSRVDEIGEMLIHRVHAKVATGLHDRVDLVGLALADQVGDCRCRDEDLRGHCTTASADLLDQGLTDHTLKRGCE